MKKNKEIVTLEERIRTLERELRDTEDLRRARVIENDGLRQSLKFLEQAYADLQKTVAKLANALSDLIAWRLK